MLSAGVSAGGFLDPELPVDVGRFHEEIVGPGAFVVFRGTGAHALVIGDDAEGPAADGAAQRQLECAGAGRRFVRGLPDDAKAAGFDWEYRRRWPCRAPATTRRAVSPRRLAGVRTAGCSPKKMQTRRTRRPRRQTFLSAFQKIVFVLSCPSCCLCLRAVLVVVATGALHSGGFWPSRCRTKKSNRLRSP